MERKAGVMFEGQDALCALIALPCGDRAERRLIAGFGGFRAAPGFPAARGAFYAPDFRLEQKSPWIVPDRFSVEGSFAVCEERRPVDSGRFSPLVRDVVEREVEFIVSRIAAGAWRKVVPVWFERSGWTPRSEEVRTLLRNALVSPHPLIPYGFVGLGEGMIGVTPEVLFRVDTAGVLTTMALAGTHPILPGATEGALLSDPKERGEHELVIEFIREAVGDLGALTVGETEVRAVPGLRHLYTSISVQLKNPPDFEDLVRRLHPTPALGAVPRASGLQWLFEREGVVPRGRHGAPFGAVLPSGEMICLVAIRNLQWNQGGSAIGAGCGIVAGSTPEREYAEACAKIASVRSMLGLVF